MSKWTKTNASMKGIFHEAIVQNIKDSLVRKEAKIIVHAFRYVGERIELSSEIRWNNTIIFRNDIV